MKETVKVCNVGGKKMKIIVAEMNEPNYGKIASSIMRLTKNMKLESNKKAQLNKRMVKKLPEKESLPEKKKSPFSVR